jgi:tetratricopeptide (TPR) repeat protein
MKAGEISWFKLVNAYNCIPGKEDSVSTLYYQIEMVEHAAPNRSKDDHNLEERFKYMGDTRTKGNAHYSKGNFYYAIREYNKVLNYINIWPKTVKKDEAVEADIRNVIITTKNNLS